MSYNDGLTRRQFVQVGTGAAAAAFLAGMVGCSSGSGSGSGSGSAAASKTLTFGCQSYSDGALDPADQINTAWNSMRYGITECLFKFDDQMEVKGWLATDDYTVSDDHKTWVFNIRKDVKFSNGTALTATAVKKSFERLWKDGAEGSSKPQDFLEAEAVLTADDDKGTLTVETQTAYVDLRKNLAYPVMSIVDVEGTTDYDRAIIGTGPYAVKEYKTNVGYTLVKNENYYEDVPFETVELMYLGDATAKANALKSGQIVLTENISTATDLNELKADDAYNVSVANGVRCGLSFMNFDGALKNEALRQAIIMAIDGQTVCDVTVGGLYTYGYSVLPSNLDYNYDKLNNPWKFDAAAAADVLDKAGIKDTDNDGIRELDGEPVKLTWITYENRCLADLAQAGQQQLKEIGIDIDLKVVDSETLGNLQRSGEFDLSSSNWMTVGTGDPSSYLANWATGNVSNASHYSNDKFDAAYTPFLTEFDKEKRKEYVTTMQQVLIDDAAVLVHGYYNSSMISAKSAIAQAGIHTADYYWLTTEITPVA